MKWHLIILALIMIPVVQAALDIGFDDPNIPRVILSSPVSTTGADGNASSICEGATVLLGNGSCMATADISGAGGISSVDYSNVALTNESALWEDTFNVTMGENGWFFGMFKWFIDDFTNPASTDYLTFNGSTLSFVESALNATIDFRAKGFNETSLIILSNATLYNYTLSTFEMFNATWDSSDYNKFGYNHSLIIFTDYNSTWDQQDYKPLWYNYTDLTLKSNATLVNFTLFTFENYNSTWDNRALIGDYNETGLILLSNTTLTLGGLQTILNGSSMNFEKLGVNIAKPTYQLEVNADDLGFNASGYLYVNSTNVGIGTPSPATPLHVTSPTAVTFYALSPSGNAAGLVAKRGDGYGIRVHSGQYGGVHLVEDGGWVAFGEMAGASSLLDSTFPNQNQIFKVFDSAGVNQVQFTGGVGIDNDATFTDSGNGGLTGWDTYARFCDGDNCPSPSLVGGDGDLLLEDDLEVRDDVYIGGYMGFNEASPDAPIEIKDNYVSNLGQIHLDSSTYAMIALDSGSTSYYSGFRFMEGGNQRMGMFFDKVTDVLSFYSWAVSKEVMMISQAGNIAMGLDTNPDVSIVLLANTTANEYEAVTGISGVDVNLKGSLAYHGEIAGSPVPVAGVYGHGTNIGGSEIPAGKFEGNVEVTQNLTAENLIGSSGSANRGWAVWCDDSDNSLDTGTECCLAAGYSNCKETWGNDGFLYYGIACNVDWGATTYQALCY